MEFYVYYLKCDLCKNVDLIPGPRRDSMTWTDFVMLLKKSPEARNHFKYCDTCKKMTHTILIAFDAE